MTTLTPQAVGLPAPKKQRPKKPPKVHPQKDRLGRELVIGDAVAVAHHNQLMVAKIEIMNPKMLRVRSLEPGKFYSYRDRGYLKRPDECIKIDGPDITMYILAYQNKKD